MIQFWVPSAADIRMAKNTISQMRLAELRPVSASLSISQRLIELLTQEYKGERNSLGTSTARFFVSSETGMR